MAKSVKESGSNSGRQRLLLETEKSAFFHKSNVIAGIGDRGLRVCGTDIEGKSVTNRVSAACV